jgi:hypothetical protein
MFWCNNKRIFLCFFSPSFISLSSKLTKSVRSNLILHHCWVVLLVFWLQPLVSKAFENYHNTITKCGYSSLVLWSLYHQWIHCISLCPIHSNQWIHSKCLSEITFVIGTHFVIVQSNNSWVWIFKHFQRTNTRFLQLFLTWNSQLRVLSLIHSLIFAKPLPPHPSRIHICVGSFFEKRWVFKTFDFPNGFWSPDQTHHPVAQQLMRNREAWYFLAWWLV